MLTKIQFKHTAKILRKLTKIHKFKHTAIIFKYFQNLKIKPCICSLYFYIANKYRTYFIKENLNNNLQSYNSSTNTIILFKKNPFIPKLFFHHKNIDSKNCDPFKMISKNLQK
eukprot:TRINITY_DN30900_c1_g1_i4.p3 TRINITY_DN30900_c1_g1~~TRINITY_DN30900_c1_g1_i4.p3  ORF type:complete len:113 (+),score=0.24 TRINITY_DN30900_c1_g1_i4:304-642(+)